MHHVPVALAALLAVPAAAAFSAATCLHEEETRDSRGNMLLQAGSRILKDPATSNGDDGFTIHLFNSREAKENSDSVVVRPLFKKTYMCETSNPCSCQECSGGPGCFNLRQNYDGLEYLYVEAGAGKRRRASWQHHRIRVNFLCPEVAEFTISARVTVKGRQNRVSMKVDRQPSQRRLRRLAGGGPGTAMHALTLTKTWSSVAGRVLELDLHFMLRHRGWAKVRDIRIQTSSEYLACQDQQTCLQVLGESGEGLNLRNDNSLQLSCLDGGLLGNDACGEWKTCLGSVGNMNRTRTLLLAAGVRGSAERAEGGGSLVLASLEAVESTSQAVQQVPVEEEDSCIDPRIDDPASWLCSCLDVMEDTCTAISSRFSPENWSPQNCLTAQMCLDPLNQICGDWKLAVGCDSPAYAELKAALANYMGGAGPAPSPSPEPPAASTATPTAALLARAQGTRHAARGAAALDGTVRGKATACN